MSMIKVIFFGTTNFGIPALEALIKNNFEIVAIITTPDAPAGRKKVLAPSPIKTFALSRGLKVFQPEKLKANPVLIKEIQTLKPDVGIVAAYGKIIPKEIFDIPRFGALNIHPSLLPKYRGPTPIQTAILSGDKYSGVTIIKIDEQVDHGPIIGRSGPIDISDKIFTEVHEILAKIGAELLVNVIPDHIGGKILPAPQKEEQATFTKIFTVSDAQIDSGDTAENIFNKIRALNPEPGTFIILNEKIRLKIIAAETVISEKIIPGKIISIIAGRLALSGANGSVIVKTIQPEGKKIMTADDFIRGYRHLL